MAIVLLLASPFFTTFSYEDDIDREEAITEITVEPRGSGVIDVNEMWASNDLFDRIDQQRSPISRNQLSSYNVMNGVRDAFWSASRRARTYSEAKRAQLDRIEAHQIRMRNIAAVEREASR